ncbi:hypothetical protein J437_LFUL009239 [Ladona fulva]|uniref:Uncharacterized protein n=1 Tax=Ladona fulva TaxID=123851 RepID=A0A8K0KKN4_LADFU|nr:hypothetical protein J437_LFUL009239 [Ladona fulva]
MECGSKVLPTRRENASDVMKTEDLGLTSTPMIRLAPAALQPIATASPTAPRPHMATLDPASTFATFTAAPYPVVIPQPNRQTLSKGAVSFILKN